MDAVELSRQRASELHYAAVERGLNPYNPFAFALGEASSRDIEVSKVPKDDPRLRGGQAVFDPDALLIMYEATGSTFGDAFLIAHELGHVVLDGQSEASISVVADAERVSESAPTGIDRVVDYSHRQRREVQMDLFAREFLLPRTWLIELHVAQNRTASEIATTLQVPFAVVAQQLLDGLLLPREQSVEVESIETIRLNDEQREAVQHRGPPLLLVAGPGSGKTGALTGRVASLLEEGIDPAKILVLTFSNKAANELVERILKRNPSAVQIWIGTFHGFGLDIIRRFHDLLQVPRDPRLLDRTEALERLEQIYPALNLTHHRNLWDPSRPLSEVLKLISRAYDEVVDSQRFLELATAMSKRARTDDEYLAAEKQIEVAKIFAVYEQLKRREGCVDFGDLIAMPIKLCEQFDVVKEYMAGLYEHVLVDEYQDVNRSSIRLLQCLKGEGRNLWVVGDAKQSIYRSRGASSFNIDRFCNSDFRSGVRKELRINYRSSEEIVRTVVSFAEGMKVVQGGPVRMDSNLGPSKTYPQHVMISTADDEVEAIAQKIAASKRDGYQLRDHAVLCAGNDRLARIAEGLEHLEIPVLNLGNLFERPEIRDILAVLSILVDRRAVGLVRIATIDGFEIALHECDKVLSYLKERTTQYTDWLDEIDRIPDLSIASRTSLERLKTLLAGLTASASPWESVAKILLDRTRWAADIYRSTNTSCLTRGVAIWQFMNFTRSQPAAKGLPVRRLLDRIRRLVLLADERDLRQLPACASGVDAVRLMTIHCSKGLEFPIVHIPGMNMGSLPQYTNSMLARAAVPPDGMIEGAPGSGRESLCEALDTEQECLFFVAISRAMKGLFLYSAGLTADGKKRAVSPFVGRLESLLQCSRETFKSPRGAHEDRIAVEFMGPLLFTDHQIQLYRKCPRRFFYTHVLGISARRVESDFMKLHSAVQVLVDMVCGNITTDYSQTDIETELEAAFIERGLDKHGCRDELFKLGASLAATLGQLTQKYKKQAVETIQVDFGELRVMVTPDQILLDEQGNIVARRVRIGHAPSDDASNLSVAAFQIAIEKLFPSAQCQILYLSDGGASPLKLSSRVIANRTATIAGVGQAIRAGLFPVAEDSRNCPRCPAYFVCSRVPAGSILKNNSATLTVPQ